jgi:predicted amidohydrolase YtcJ
VVTTLLINGPVFDGHRYHDATGGVVVVDGVVERLLAVGEEPPEADVVIDQRGGLLTPGFIDAHVHAVQGGLERIRCDLSHLDDRDAYLAAIKEYADAHPDLPWILGGGWAMAAFPGGTPTAADLDLVVPDRPVFLPNRDHHGAWVNSAALALAGLTAATPDPVDGRLERDATGAPSGTLHEGAMGLVTAYLPLTTAEELMAALLEGQSYLHSVGVTGWQDAIIGDYAGIADAGPTYLAAARAGTLVSDVVGALWWDRERGVEQIPELVAGRERLSAGRFRATSVKVMADGVPENGTASMSEPYLDRCGHATHNRGNAFVDPATFAAAAPELAREGFQIHVHAIGDAAVTASLDALAEADAAVPAGDLRHHVAHLQFVRPADLQRFGALGIAVNMQSLWACRDDQMADLVIPAVGEERAGWQYPWAALAAGGAPLVAGSDWPVSTPDPWQALHVAVNRTDPAYGGEPLNPDQALDLATALSAYTAGSAWVNHRDDAGAIAPGHVADLVLHDRDPFAAPSGEIADTRVVATWIGGAQVYPTPSQ